MQQEKITPAIKPTTNKQQKTQDETDYSHFLIPKSEEWLKRKMREKPTWFKTGFKIAGQEIEFPSGAISIIAAPTSHGKTTMLINYALGALEQEANKGKSVAFFTYEESSEDILCQMLNIWFHKKMNLQGIFEAISQQSRKSIEHYYTSGSDEYMKADTKDMFKNQVSDFFKNFIDNNRLMIHYTDIRAEELVALIRYLKDQSNVGLIVIDYIQLIKLTKTKNWSRQEEIKEICLLLKNCAIETGLPIVLAAQFNRTVVAEADISLNNIREAADIEHITTFAVGMFNRKFQMSRAGNIDKLGNSIQPEDKIYFEVLKGRKTGFGYAEAINFDGNRGILLTTESYKKKPRYSLG